MARSRGHHLKDTDLLMVTQRDLMVMIMVTFFEEKRDAVILCIKKEKWKGESMGGRGSQPKRKTKLEKKKEELK